MQSMYNYINICCALMGWLHTETQRHQNIEKFLDAKYMYSGVAAQRGGEGGGGGVVVAPKSAGS